MRVCRLNPNQISKICLFRTFLPLLLITISCIAVQAQTPSITSFTPNPVCQGSAITITGANFTNASAVICGNLDAASFTVNNDNTITAVIADGATSGSVTVTNPSGTGSLAGLTIQPSPKPDLTDVGNPIAPFTNCNGNATYVLRVSNSSATTGSNNAYQINWGDNTAPFSATDWASNAQTTHTYMAQGYFTITITITPSNGCTKSTTYQFYNGQNPLASFTTSASTTGLCIPATVEFVIGNWFNNSAGTTYKVIFGDGTSSVTLQHPLNSANTVQLLSHIYNTSSCPAAVDYTARLEANNGCFTTTYTLNQIIIRKKPVANFSFNPSPACFNSAVCFTNQTTNGYSGNNNCITTGTFNWDFGDGTTSTAPTPPCHTYASPGNYSVVLSAANPACGSDAITKTITVVAPSPPPVVVTPVMYCQGKPAAQLTATGTNLLWYTSATGGTGSPTAPTPSTSIAGSTTWYVSQTLPNSCESARVPIVVTVNASPSAPAVTTPVLLCQNQSAAPLTASGTGLLWYSTATGGTGSATPPTPGTAVVGNSNFYVSQTVNGCEGPRAVITVSVSALPLAPAVSSPINYCQNQTAAQLTASGTGLLWYTTSTGGTGSATPPTPSTATPGSTTYYVSQTTSCGEGPRAAITVNVNASPSATISYTPTVLCNVANTPVTPNPPIAVTQTGSPGGSYSVSPAGLSINTTTGEINPSGATPGNYTIRYTVPGSGGCTNFVATATVSVSGTPNAAISYPGICTSDNPVRVALTGTAGGSFSAPGGLTIDQTTGTITPASSTAGTYTVTYTVLPSPPCPGFTTNTSVTVSQAPSAAISYSPATLCNVVNTVTTPNTPVPVTQTGTPGGSYSVSPAGLSINTTTGEINPSGATPGNYTIRYTVPGSGGCTNFVATATVSVSGTPNATISYPGICTSDNPVRVALTGTAGGSFSAAGGLTIDQPTGTITPASSTAGTYTVTYTVLPSPPCPGFTTSTSVTVSQAPSATISYSPATLCNVVNTVTTPNAPVPVTQTGTPGGTYSVSPAGLSINAATGAVNPSGATAGVYTIKYTIPGSGGCAVYAITTTVTVNATPVATIQYPGSPWCRSNNTPQRVNLSGATGGTFSAGTGLSINSSTGDINPSLSTPGVYTVTYTIAAAPPCPGFVTTTTVQIDDNPVITFPAATQAICSGGTAVFTPSSTVPNTTYNWRVTTPLPANVSGISTGSVGGANPILSLSFTNTGTTSQTLTIQVTPVNAGQNPCAGTPYTLTLIVNPIPPAPLIDTLQLCMGTPPAALSISSLPGTTIKWYDQNQVLLNAAPVISTTNPALFTYYASQSYASGCESPKSKAVVIVHPTPVIVGSSYKDPTACGIPSGSIVLNLLDLNNNPIPNVPVTVHYTKFQTPLTYTGNTDASGKVTIPLTAGTYSGISVETYGCASQKIPPVFVLKDPSPPAQPVAGYNPPICSGTPLTLTALSPTSTVAGPIDYVWAGHAFGPTPDTVKNTSITFPSASVADAGTYVVYASQNNCISLATSLLVDIKQAPSKPVIVTRTPLCVGDNLYLQAYSSIPGPNPVLQYVWKGPGTGFPVNAPSAGINNVKVADGGIYSITVSSPQTGCSATSDTLIQIGGYPIVKFARDSLVLPTGYLLPLTPAVTNAADPGILPMKRFTWTPAEDIACNDAVCAAPVATIKNNTCFIATGTNIYGCSGADTLCVKVFCKESQVLIANAFTPRGPVPENTKLVVRATGIVSVKSFRVFNRWGRIVFEKNNFPPNDPSFGWDGQVNGKPGDTGVYIYTIDVMCENGVPYTYKGNVTLL